jgi:hypothetical protein
MMRSGSRTSRPGTANVAKVAISSIVPMAGLAAVARSIFQTKSRSRKRSMSDRNDLLVLVHTRGCSDT